MASRSTASSAPKVAFPSRFIPQPKTARPNHQVRRDPEGCQVTKTGRTPVNRAGSDMFLALAAALGLDLGKCGIFWAADPKTGDIAGRLVPPDMEGATPIRRHVRRNTLTVWLRHIFEAYPDLRPATNSWVTMSRQPDEEHGDYFVIHLNLALPRVKGGRSARSSGGKKQAEQKAEKPPAPTPEKPETKAGPAD